MVSSIYKGLGYWLYPEKAERNRIKRELIRINKQHKTNIKLLEIPSVSSGMNRALSWQFYYDPSDPSEIGIINAHLIARIHRYIKVRLPVDH